MYGLTKHEELILISILRLRGNAYIVTIRKQIKELTKKSINYGSLCNTLSALGRKGYLESTESEPTAQQGGRRKVMYYLTNAGKKALVNAYEIQKLTWIGFTDFLTEFK